MREGLQPDVRRLLFGLEYRSSGLNFRYGIEKTQALCSQMALPKERHGEARKITDPEGVGSRSAPPGNWL